MNRFRRCLALVACLVLPLAQAQTMSPVLYQAEQVRIADDHRSLLRECALLERRAREICVEQFKGQENIARAQLEYRAAPSALLLTRLHTARAEAAFAVARKQCEERPTASRPACMQDANWILSRALADARSAPKPAAVPLGAAPESPAAAFHAAAAKCQGYTGDARLTCRNAALRRLGKV
jgi:hypothetical protein